jgi:DNA-binding MarR family transcriptional regulator
MRRKKINPTLDQLSPRERATLDYLQGYRKGRYRVPTIREISAHIDLSVSATHDLVKRLEEYGYVERRNWPSGGRKRRNIRLLPRVE